MPLLLTTLVFLLVATVATGVRQLVGAVYHFGPHAVLVTLVSIWTLPGLLMGVLLRD